ncbi:dedicator of cytokinesis 7 [Brachionus plicatilis]|uniref:Dedicator of cytokinesis 7 n=1 Tax=Brachionus plicatilis TaxID=10195 RepID=A0A3M7SZ51_BRAPC|nr:dedicator of cytokinesis 7 [Brachionus plicatilis]
MEPIDYEKFIITNRNELENDPFRHLVIYPNDDIELVEIQKKINTLEFPKPEIEAELDIHISECIKSYNSNFRILRKNYEKFSSFNLIKSKKSDLNRLSKKCEVQEYECDQACTDVLSANLEQSDSQQQQRTSWLLSDLETLEPDPILKVLFERLPPELIDRETEKLRETQRVNCIFQFYPNQDFANGTIVVENRPNPPAPRERDPNRVLLKCTHLKFDLEIEPVWASMALYDLKSKKKVSENFYFDMNSDALKHMLSSHQTHEDMSTQAKACILNISHPCNDLYLVIRVDKVLQQGDISECAEPYVKAQQQSQSAMEKLSANAQQFCERLGKYRMAFVWTAINVMSILGSNQTSEESGEKSASLERRSAAAHQSKFYSASVKNAYESFRKGARDESLTRRASSAKEPKNDQLVNLAKFKPIAISINTFFKQESDKLSDEDLFRCLNDLKKSANSIKKLKCLPGCLKLEFSPFSSNESKSVQNFFLLSPELQLIKSNSLISSQVAQEKTHYHQPLVLHNHLLPIKDLLEFYSYPIYETNYLYRNLLFIYPLSINLCGSGSSKGSANSAASGPNTANNSLLNSSSARNIAIKVNLMKGEDGEHCALPVIFAKSSSTTEYCREVFANVVYHNKTPQYNDEIKIKLPALVGNANYHLLFTFYHVSCQNSKDQLDTVIGYSWLPLEQQFQYETTVQFVNVNGPGLQAASSLNQDFDTKKGAVQDVENKLGSFTKITRCQMLKSGVYSLPITFEKLPSGYSTLNYSIFDNANNTAPSTIFDEQTDSYIENGANKEEKIACANITNVTTTITNSTSSSTSLPSQVQANGALPTSINSKSFFDLRLNLISTIHTQDVYLENFLKFSNLNNQNQQLGIELSKLECQLLKQSIADLVYVDTEVMCRYLNLVLDKLFNLMVNSKSLASLCLESVAKIANRMNNLAEPGHKQSHLLVQYVKYATNLDYCLLHEDILNEWLSQMAKKPNQESQLLRDLLLKNAGFFFDMMLKSLGLFLLKFKPTINANTTLNLSLTSKISKKFLFDLEKLIKLLVIEMIQMQQVGLNRVQQSFRSCSPALLNFEQLRSSERLCSVVTNSLAFFLNDLFSLIDRTYLFRLVDLYFTELHKYQLNLHTQLKLLAKSSLNVKQSQLKFLLLNSTRVLSSHQLDFLRILSSNEHFVQLNLPVAMATEPKLYESREYFQRHYLIGLIVRQVFRTLHLPFKSLHFKSSQLVRNLIEANDLDLRYQTAKFRLAQLYFPLVNLTLHFAPLLVSAHQFKSCHVTEHCAPEFDAFIAELNLAEDCASSESLTGLNVHFELNHDLDYLTDLDAFNEQDGDQPNCFYPLFDNFSHEHADELSVYDCLSRKHCLCCPNALFATADESGLSLKTSHDLLVSFLWIIKNADKKFLFSLLSTWTYAKINKMLTLVDLSVNLFEYKSGGIWWTSNSSELAPELAAYQTPKHKSKFKSKIEELIAFKKQHKDDHESDSKVKWRTTKHHTHQHLILEANLCTELVLVALDFIDLLVKLIQTNQHTNFLFDSHSHSHLVLCNTMRTLLNTLGLHQSTKALANLFAYQRSLVSKFPELLFDDGQSELCGLLCTRLLKHCTSSLEAVRGQASASLYFLMRQNFDIGNQFLRLKTQVTVSLSTLVSGNGLGAETSEVCSQFLNVTCLQRALKTLLVYGDSDGELAESSFGAQLKELVLNLNTIVSDTVKMRESQDDAHMLVDLMHRVANCYQNSADMRLVWLQSMAHKHLQLQNLAEAGQCVVHAAALVAEQLALVENRAYLPVGCAAFSAVSVNVLEESAVSDEAAVGPFDDAKFFSEAGLVGLVEQAAVFLVHSQHYEVANQLYKILIPIYEAHRDVKKLSQVHSKLHDCFNKILLSGNKRLFGTYFRVGFYGELFAELNGQEFVYKEPAITKLAEIAHRLEAFYAAKWGASSVHILKDSGNVDKSALDLANKAYIQITYVEPFFDRYELAKCQSFFERSHSLKRFVYATPFTLDGKAHGPLDQQYKRKTVLSTERAFPYVKTRVAVIDKQQFVLGPVEVAVEDLQKKIDELKSATLQEPADPKILQMVLQGCVGTTVNQGPLEMALRLCFKEFSRRCADALRKNKTLIGSDQHEYQREMERNYAELKAKIDPLIENKIFKSSHNNLKSY